MKVNTLPASYFLLCAISIICLSPTRVHSLLQISQKNSNSTRTNPRDRLANTYDAIINSTTRRGLPISKKKSQQLLKPSATNFILKALDHLMKQKWGELISFSKRLDYKSPLPGSTVTNIDASIKNFRKVMGIRQGENVLMLTDPLLDPRVVDAVKSLAEERGAASFTVYEGESTRYVSIPPEVRPIVANATFVVSTWFASVFDPFCQNLRRQHGQRWVKITFFRDLDLWETPMASYPLEIVSEIVQATQRLYPPGPFELRITDPRGTDLRIPFSKEMRDNMRVDNRWRGHNTADEDGCYVHYLPTHGPNLYDPFMFGNDPSYKVGISGIIRPQWSVGVEAPFLEDEIPEIEFLDDRVVAVRGEGKWAPIFRDFLVNGTLEELGCGHNPKAPRFDIYPAGPNSPGALHFGINGLVESDFFLSAMPDWEEPHVHADLVCYDCTVMAGDHMIVDGGFLLSLEDPKVIEAASVYGDPVEILSLFA